MFFPFVAFWGGLTQFLVGVQGYAARGVSDGDTLHVGKLLDEYWDSVSISCKFAHLCLKESSNRVYRH